MGPPFLLLLFYFLQNCDSQQILRGSNDTSLEASVVSENSPYKPLNQTTSLTRTSKKNWRFKFLEFPSLGNVK